MKTSLKNKLFLGASAGLCLALLSGCGGGGSGSGSGGIGLEGRDGFNGDTRIQNNAVGIEEKTSELGTNSPKESSVVQSSNADGGQTTDDIEVTFDSDNNEFSIVMDGSAGDGTSFTIGSDEVEHDAIFQSPEGLVGFELEKDVGGGHLFVAFHSDNVEAEVSTYTTPVAAVAGTRRPVEVGDTLSDYNLLGEFPQRVVINGVEGELSRASSNNIELDNGQVESVSGYYFTPSEGSTSTETVRTATYAVTDTTNWLAGGVWLYISDDSNTIEIGVFADGGDPFDKENIEGLTGEATYTGDATGLWALDADGTATDGVGYFDARIELEADFGAANRLGTISGSVSDFAFLYGEETLDLDVDFDLPSADITNVNDGGFFQAQDSQTAGSNSLSVSWGGQFFGNDEENAEEHPSSVAGTFGVALESEEGELSLSGFFHAHQ